MAAAGPVERNASSHSFHLHSIAGLCVTCVYLEWLMMRLPAWTRTWTYMYTYARAKPCEVKLRMRCISHGIEIGKTLGACRYQTGSSAEERGLQHARSATHVNAQEPSRTGSFWCGPPSPTARWRSLRHHFCPRHPLATGSLAPSQAGDCPRTPMRAHASSVMSENSFQLQPSLPQTNRRCLTDVEPSLHLTVVISIHTILFEVVYPPWLHSLCLICCLNHFSRNRTCISDRNLYTIPNPKYSSKRGSTQP